MIRINLLPLTERQEKWPVNRLLLGCGLFVLLLLTTIYSYSIFETWHLEKQLLETRNQYQLLQPTQALMLTANQKQQEFDKKNTVMTAVTKERRSWYSIIQHLSQVTSSQVWFTEMGKGEKDIIQIKGWASTYPLVADFMRTMENDQFFVDPVLVTVEKPVGSQAAKFEIQVKPRGM